MLPHDWEMVYGWNFGRLADGSCPMEGDGSSLHVACPSWYRSWFASLYYLGYPTIKWLRDDLLRRRLWSIYQLPPRTASSSKPSNPKARCHSPSQWMGQCQYPCSWPRCQLQPRSGHALSRHRSQHLTRPGHRQRCPRRPKHCFRTPYARATPRS